MFGPGIKRQLQIWESGVVFGKGCRILDLYQPLSAAQSEGSSWWQKREEIGSNTQIQMAPANWPSLFPSGRKCYFQNTAQSKPSAKVLGEAAAGHTWRAQQSRQNLSMAMEYARGHTTPHANCKGHEGLLRWQMSPGPLPGLRCPHALGTWTCCLAVCFLSPEAIVFPKEVFQGIVSHINSVQADTPQGQGLQRTVSNYFIFQRLEENETFQIFSNFYFRSKVLF